MQLAFHQATAPGEDRLDAYMSADVILVCICWIQEKW